MVTINLDSLHIILGLISIIGGVGFQVGIHWTFKKEVEIRLKAHEDKLELLDKHREDTNLTLQNINSNIEAMNTKLDNMKEFCRLNE